MFGFGIVVVSGSQALLYTQLNASYLWFRALVCLDHRLLYYFSWFNNVKPPQCLRTCALPLPTVHIYI